MSDLEFQQKCLSWYEGAFAEITRAGGVPVSVLSLMPEALKQVLIRNDIQLVYVGK